MKSFFNLRESTKKMTARDKWNRASDAREKKHNDIEAKRQDALKQGKENMSGSIDRLAARFNTEEMHHKVGDSVTVKSKFFGMQKGKVTKIDNQSIHVQRTGKMGSEKYPHDAVMKEEVSLTEVSKSEVDSHFHSWTNSEHAPYNSDAGDDNKIHRSALNYLSSTNVPKEKHEKLAQHIANKYHGSGIGEQVASTPLQKAIRKKYEKPKVDGEKLNIQHGSKNMTEGMSAGELADKAYGISSKGPSGDAIKAHRAAAKAYDKEGDKNLSQRHNEIAQGHMKSMTQA